MMVGLSVWVTFQLGHRGAVRLNTHSQSFCLRVYECDSSVSGGVRALAGGEPRGSGLIPAVIGFGAGRALQSVPISLLPPCDIQKTAVAIGSACVYIQYAYTHTHTDTHTHTNTQSHGL